MQLLCVAVQAKGPLVREDVCGKGLGHLGHSPIWYLKETYRKSGEGLFTVSVVIGQG